MYVTLSYKGKPFGEKLRNLEGEELLEFIAAEMLLGRTVHIEPDEEDIAD